MKKFWTKISGENKYGEEARGKDEIFATSMFNKKQDWSYTFFLDCVKIQLGRGQSYKLLQTHL